MHSTIIIDHKITLTPILTISDGEITQISLGKITKTINPKI